MSLSIRRTATTFLVAAALTIIPAALASGGANSGGVNAGGVNAGSTGGGGGGATGGGGGGGGKTVATGPCATIATFSSSVGYYAIWAAIWTQFSVTNNCKHAVAWDMKFTNGTTGEVDYSATQSTAVMPAGTIDEDWAAFSTDYTVTITVTDPATGVVLGSKSALVSTGASKL